ncbi:MAG: general secretion pathway protein GspF [Gammaproteobacteria bacterium]|nr:MAG: general secretion pathway protein GspF [Gammaproteobacteria bacterium]
MKRARTVDEYVALIKEAIYEVGEMRAAIEYDEEYMGDANKFITELEQQLLEMFESMKDGSYCWRTGDLKYMDIIRDVDDRLLPFRSLLIRINDTHKNGLEPGDE